MKPNAFCAAVCGLAVALASASADEAQWRDLKLRTTELMNQGRIREAAHLAEQALAIAEQTFGANDLRLAGDLANFGTMLFYMREHGRAEEALRRAVTIYDARLGGRHGRSQPARGSLARVLHAAGKYAEAELLYLETIELMTHTLGADYPTTIDARLNLGQLYAIQGKIPEAEAQYAIVLRARTAHHGPESLPVAEILDETASMYRRLGVLQGLDIIYERILAIVRRRHPEPHDAALLDPLVKLATLYRDLNRPAKAAPLFGEALALHEALKGPDYLESQADMDRMARLHYSGDIGATTMLMWDMEVGNDRHGRLTLLNGLAEAYRLLGRYREEAPVRERIDAIARRAFGPDHPEPASAIHRLADAYVALDRLAEAQPLYARLVALCERAETERRDLLEAYLTILAPIHFGQEDYDEAIRRYRQLVSVQQLRHGRDDVRVAHTLNNLGEVLRLRGRFDEALALYQRALRIMEAAGEAGGHAVARQALLRNLAVLHRQMGDDAQAEAVRGRLADEVESSAAVPRVNLDLPWESQAAEDD